jgi:tetratricopeptide (TPR) repeat protein
MDRNDFFNDEMAERIRSFEARLERGEVFFIDTSELEDIINYYLDFNLLKKAEKAVRFGKTIYPYEVLYTIKEAEIQLAKGNANNAQKLLYKARDLEPRNTEIARLLGDAYLAKKQFQRAIDCYEFALEYEADSEEIRFKLARVYYLTHKEHLAIQHIYALPPSFMASEFDYQEFAALFIELEQPEIAEQFFNAFIERDPYSFAAWYYLALVFQKFEMYEKAINAFEFCIAIDDQNPDGFQGKGNCLMEKGAYTEAIEYLKKALDNEFDEGEILCNIAECYENMENLSSAKYYYFRAVKADPMLDDAYFGLAMIYKKQGKHKQREINLLKAIELDELESMYHIELAELYLEYNEEEKCLYSYKKAYELDPETPEVILDYAQALHHFEHTDIAIKKLEAHLSKEDDDYRFFYRLASYLYCIGLVDKAEYFLHEALTLRADEYPLLYAFAPFTEHMENVTNIIDLYLHKSND